MIGGILFVASALLVGQTQTSTQSLDPVLRAVQAAERAATAAQAAAEAASLAAGTRPRPSLFGEVLAEPRLVVSPETPTWAGSVGFGLIWIAGSAETLALSGNGAIERKSNDWIWSAKAGGGYGQSAAASNGVTEVVALNASLFLRGDRRLTPMLSAYLAGGADTDHIKSVEVRGAGEGGVGLLWYEDKVEDFVKTALRTDLAFRYVREFRFQYYPAPMDLDDVDVVAPKLGIAFRYALSKEALFSEDAEILPNIVGASRVLLNSASKLSFRLTSLLSFATALQLGFDSSPAPGKRELDSALTIGLEFSI